MGYSKLLRHAAKLQYKRAEGIKDHASPFRHRLRIKGIPYVFARYRDRDTGKEVRPELGRWLLDSGLPVAHLNRDPLDFRLENLVAQETDRQLAVHQRAALKRERREERSAKWAAKRAADHARRPEKGSDDLTPEQQEAELCSTEFQQLLLRVAGSFVKDHMQPGKAGHPNDEMRAPEIVAEVTAASLKPIREGRVKNVRAFTYSAVRTQANNERKRMLEKLGHVK